ncbi:hypothetical protein FRC06_001560 [Ceratobasidium sp. 370]|nr:hypothetical protein FRC06_001560 [Ceratobasidium sp. 370]
MSGDHLDKPHRLGELGATDPLPSERLGRFDGLHKAISYLEQAVFLTPDGHPDKPHSFGELGATCLSLFQRLGRLDDLRKAISYLEQAVFLTPDGHPDKPRRLGALAAAYRELPESDRDPEKPQDPAPGVIHSLMPALEIVQHLGKHGCKDITESLDIDSCGRYPISTGGFGDVYRGRLNGLSVAIKTMRLGIGSSEDEQKHLKSQGIADGLAYLHGVPIVSGLGQ